jgi:nicotinamidase-related amidase
VTAAPVDVLLVVDMQEGLLRGAPKHDLAGVVERINRLAAPGWPILSSIEREPADRVVRKTLNDAFFGTSLESELARLGAKRLLVAGWATDLCVDATVRSAATRGFQVVAVSDCHTVSDRPHLSARQVIEHHHWVWTNLLAPYPVTIAREAEIY